MSYYPERDPRYYPEYYYQGPPPRQAPARPPPPRPIKKEKPKPAKKPAKKPIKLKPIKISSNTWLVIGLSILVIGVSLPIIDGILDYQEFVNTPLCEREGYLEKKNIEYPELCHKVEELVIYGMSLTDYQNTSLGNVLIEDVDRNYYYPRLIDDENIIKTRFLKQKLSFNLYQENGTAKILLIKDRYPGRETEWRWFVFKENIYGKWAFCRSRTTLWSEIDSDTPETIVKRGLAIFRSENRKIDDLPVEIPTISSDQCLNPEFVDELRFPDYCKYIIEFEIYNLLVINADTVTSGKTIWITPYDYILFSKVILSENGILDQFFEYPVNLYYSNGTARQFVLWKQASNSYYLKKFNDGNWYICQLRDLDDLDYIINNVYSE